MIIEKNQYKKHLLEHLDCHEFYAWIKIEDLLTESSSAKRKFSIETLVGEIILAVTAEYRDKSIALITFWNSRTTGIMMEGSEKLVFQSNHPPQMSGFPVGP